jgi:hypothetical protein
MAPLLLYDKTIFMLLCACEEMNISSENSLLSCTYIIFFLDGVQYFMDERMKV